MQRVAARKRRRRIIPRVADASGAALRRPASRAAHDYQRAVIRGGRSGPLDPARYDDALYGEIPGRRPSTIRPSSNDPYAYQDGYDDAAEEPAPKRRGGLTTVAAVVALAVVGTGGAFAYRTYVGSPRSGEPPIIKADTGPTKIIPGPPIPTARCRTAWRPATAPKRSCRAKRPRSTSTPTPSPRRGWYFRR